MRKKIIASIILIIMLWQSFGNLCIAFTNSADESDNVMQETNNVVASSVNKSDDKVEIDDVVSDDKAETDNIASDSKVEEYDTASSDDKFEIDNTVSDSEVEEDDLLYSSKYLVKDKVVSRINPKTTILEFKKKVEIAEGNELSFYKKDGITQLTEGILGTGMLVRGTNGQEYRLSVKGDMTGDGEVSQVELTMMIRHLIELQGWELTDINAISGDITEDGVINLVDINKMIKYIVFEEWEYDDRTTPNPPTIEVIGNEGEEADLYTSEVIVRIVEDKSTENSKTTYKISGKIEKEESSIGENEEIKIKEDGEYLITAYTYGIQGNRSRASNRRIVISKTEEPDKPEVYNITYELNGGENNSDNPSTYTYGTEIIFKDATKEGYTFEGWYKETEFTNEIEKIEATQKGDITVYAKWRANVYNITYQLNGGENSVDNPSTYTYGTETIFKDATREGYTFEGWYKEAEFTNQITIIEVAQKGDITVYAKWRANVYNITYELNGGENSVYNSSTYTYGTETILKDPTKEGYTFEGWYKEAEFTNPIATIEATQIGDITVYAKWRVNQYAINYELNGGENSLDNPSAYTYGTETILKDPTKKGYTFEGWYKEAEFTNQITTIETTQIGDITVYAKWKQNEYQITGEAQEGGIIENAEETVKYGENSTKQIKITPNENMAVDSITVNGVEITQYEEDEETRIVTLPIFENVTENKHIIVTFNQLEVVAVIVDAPSGYESLIDEEYISIKRALEDVATDGITIQLIADIDEEFTIENYQVALDLNGKVISGDGTTVTVKSGILTLINSSSDQGKIISTKNAVYVKNGGQFNLGTDDGVVNLDTLLIQGETIGVKTEGTFNFYDGRIKGTKAIEGEVTEVPLNYNVFTSEENSKQVAVLQVIDGVEAAIGQELFSTLEEAIIYANEEIGTDGSQVQIKIVSNIQRSEAVEISENKNIKIDLNGYEISFADGENGIINNGKLEIIDSRDIGKLTSSMNSAITNNTTGELTLTSGILEIAAAGEYSTCKIAINNTGTVTINGADIKATNIFNYGIYNNESGNVIMTGGNITGYSSGIENIDGIVTITGGTITADINYNSGIDNSEGTVIVEGGTITVREKYATGIYNSMGTVIVKGGDIIAEGENSYGIFSIGTLTIEGGNITAEGISSYGVCNSSIETVIVEEGNITAEGESSYGIYNKSTGTVAVEGGNITAEETSSYGIYNYSTGTVTIGKKDGNVDVTVPEIIGSTYGVYNYSTGTINFYDGKITGAIGKAIYGDITEIEEENYIIKTIDESIGTETLILGKSVAIINKTRNIEYYDLQSAITEAQDGETLELARNIVTLSAQEIIEIEAGKEVILDLNGYNISNPIKNSGTLKIEDSSSTHTGSISSSVGDIITIVEGATLEINGGTIVGNENSTNVINNNGTLQIDGGTVKTAQYGANLINSQGTGTVIINSGKLISSGDYSKSINNQGTGELLVKGGDIIAEGKNSYGIYNSYGKTVTVEGGNITGKGKSSHGIENSGTVTVEGGNISAEGENSCGVYNYYGGILIVKSGNITAEGQKSYGIYNYSTVTIGEKDANVDITVPEIIGSAYGIYNHSYGTTINFYDGKVIGAINEAIYGSITDIEEGYDINKTIDESMGTETLILGNKSVAITNVTRNIEYYDLQSAVTEAQDGDALKLARNIVSLSTQGSIEIEAEKEVFLDLNGYNIDFGQKNAIRNLGTLGIVDSSITQTGSISSSVGNIITNEQGATLNIYEGTILGNISGVDVIYNKGTLQIDGGIVKSTYNGVRLINNQGTGTVIINSGEVISSGESSESIFHQSTGDILITGGSIIAEGESAYGIWNYSTGTVTVEEGNITAKGVRSYGIENYSAGTLTIKGGAITAEGGLSYGIWNSGIVTIEGGDIIATGETSYGISNSSGTVIVKGGIIIAEGESSYGIYNYSTGTITIGEKDGNVDITLPEIICSSYGIYNVDGTINFYDGKITGAINKSIYGSITEIEEEYDIIKTIDENIGTETVILGKSVAITNVTRNIDYYNLQSAITEAQDGEKLQLVRNIVTLSTQETIEVEAEKEVILDLNGYNIDFAQANAIKILGTLKIEDASSAQTGSVSSSQGDIVTIEEGAILEINGGTIVGNKDSTNVINNSGTLQIDGGIVKSAQYRANLINSQGVGTVIINSGELISSGDYSKSIYHQSTGDILIKGGDVTAEGVSSYGIYNYSTGTVIVEGGTVTGGKYGIYNYSTGIITIDGGSITVTEINSYVIYNSARGTVIVKEGDITVTESSSYGIYNYSGTVIVEGGTIITEGEDSYGIRNYSTGTVTMTGGTIIIEGGYSYGIFNTATGKVTMTGGTIIAEGVYSDGIYNNSTGTVTVEGGTITSTDNIGVNNSSSGTIIIGKKDGNVDVTTPEITGGYEGIKNIYSGYVYFYDGKIKGEVVAIGGDVTGVEINYEVIYLEDNTIAILQLKDTI